MARFLKRQSPNEVKAFGNLGFVGTQKMDHATIEVFDFSAKELNHFQNVNVDELGKFKESGNITWINICGLHDVDLIKKVSSVFELHPMVIDKITNTGDRPSFEDYEDYVILVLKMLHLDTENLSMESEHILFAMFDNVLITFQENQQDPFNSIRERLQKEDNRIRKSNIDYTLFALVRALMNKFTNSLEFIGQKIEMNEDEIFSKESSNLLQQLNAHNLEISFTSKAIRPAKDAIISLCKSDSELIGHEDSQYIISNVYDTVLIASDSCENYRLMLHDQLNIYHTNVASRLNEMFRVLTIFSVIFVPLTFVAGIYGMNFEVIPELSHPYGYFIVWGVMITMAGFMLIYFKRKGWL